MKNEELSKVLKKIKIYFMIYGVLLSLFWMAIDVFWKKFFVDK